MSLRKGDTLQSGKFEIEEVLGQGGYGITYKAWQPNLKRWVVLKTQNEHLRHDPDWEKYRDRFLKEGQMMEKLSKKPHPNLVRVLDLFAESSAYYLVMNFVEGQDLFKVVRKRGALPESEVTSIAKQIGRALSWMHSHQCVHRDAHPGNIMLKPDGTAILIDLGGAKDFIPSTQSTTGAFGNRGFAPYEQMTRGARHPTADVYCFAATLYYIATGEKPVPALSRKLDGAVLTPPIRIRSISKALNEGLLAGMALEAGDRPQTINDWIILLEIKPKPKVQKPSFQPSNNHAEPKTQRASGRSTLKKPAGRKIAPWVVWSGVCFISYGVAGMAVAVAGARKKSNFNFYSIILLFSLIELVISTVFIVNNSWLLDEAYGPFLFGVWWGLFPITLGFPSGFLANEISLNLSETAAIFLSIIVACLGLFSGWQIMPLIHG